MGFLKKTILLTNKNKGVNYGMAVLTVEKNNSGVFATLKTFDFKNKNLMLGVSVQGKQVVKQSVYLDNSGAYNFKLQNDFDINNSIAGVLVTLEGDKVIPLAWGCNDKRADYKENIINIFKSDKTEKVEPKNVEIKKTTHSVEVETKKTIDAHLFEEPEPNELDKFIDNEIEKGHPVSTEDDFYHLIKSQLDDLFESYPEDQVLGDIVPNSKWVRVDYENNGKEYVVGLIFEDEDIKYICYGVPGNYDVLPPANLMQYSQWLPKDLNRPQGEGYWIMYQDALSGDSIELATV